MRKYRYFIVLLFIIFNCTSIYSQTVLDYAPATPEVGAMVQNGKVSVNLYKGLPEINIPIHELRLKNFSLPISLSYNASGNKPDLYPGDVGLGWILNAGGQIYRVENGKRDIYINTFSEYLSRVQMSDWDKESNLSRYYATLTTNNDLHKEPDLDEFNVNIGTINGSFYIYKDVSGQIQTKISSKSNTYFKVKDIKTGKLNDVLLDKYTYYHHGYGKDLTYNTNIKFYEQDIIEFTLVDANGIEYIFGGDSDTSVFDIYCIYRGEMAVGAYTYDKDYLGYISSWKIRSIRTPEGEELLFKYNRREKYGDFNQITQAYSFRKSSVNVYGESIEESSYPTWEESAYYPEVALRKGYSVSYIYSSYLTDISSSRNENVKFSLSNRNDLFFKIYSGDTGNRFQKIDEININDQKCIKFKYINESTQRLRLLALEINNINNSKLYDYKFEYNPLPLPNYNSRQTDNWGYYNGKSYQDLIKNEKHDDLQSFRQSDTTKVKAEILQKIIYPTGGETYFDYEAHSYSKIAKKYPFEIKPENGIAGGLRIRSIRTVDPVEASKFITKKYYYLNEDNTSSGILSHIPKYTAKGSGKINVFPESTVNGNYTYTYKSENNISYFADSHIGYSRVIEELSDGSKTVYKYSNFDTDNDEPSCGVYSPELGEDLYSKYTSKELSRGLLQDLIVYDSANYPKKEVHYTYNSDITEYLKIINRYAFANSIPIRISANKIYTYHPYLKKETTLDYTDNGIITSSVEYKYNEYRLPTEITTYNSDGKNIKTAYKYPTDFNTVEPYKTMVSRNLLSATIQKETYKNNSVIREYTDYDNFSGLYLPKTIRKQTDNRPIKVLANFYNYDSYGNPISINTGSTTDIVYLWSYNGRYPIAEIKNASFNQAEAAVKATFGVVSIDTLSKINYQESDQASLINKFQILRTHSSLRDALISTYTYRPLVGILTASDSRGLTTYYNYDNLGRLVDTKDSNGSKVSDYTYWYQNQQFSSVLDIDVLTESVYRINQPVLFETVLRESADDLLFDWYLTNSKDSIVYSKVNTTDRTLTYQFSTEEKLTLKLISRKADLTKGKIIEKIFDVKVPLILVKAGTLAKDNQYHPDGSPIYDINYAVIFETNIPNISGSYRYSWYLKDMQGNILDSKLNTAQSEYTLGAFNEKMKLECVIRDIRAGNETTLSYTFHTLSVVEFEGCSDEGENKISCLFNLPYNVIMELTLTYTTQEMPYLDLGSAGSNYEIIWQHDGERNEDGIQLKERGIRVSLGTGLQPFYMSIDTNRPGPIERGWASLRIDCIDSPGITIGANNEIYIQAQY